MSEKQAGGDILGRLAGLVSRPFVGAQKSQAINQKVVGGITRHVNQPLERGLRRGGVHKAISKAYEYGTIPVPGTPKLLQPVMPMAEQRRAYGNWRADDIVHTVANNPEILAAGVVPVPGTTEAIIGGKHLLRKALGVKKLASLAPSFADELEKIANGDMLQYFQDHPEKLREKQERDRQKKLTREKRAEDLEEAYWRMDSLRAGRGRGYLEGSPMAERDAFKAAVDEYMSKEAQVYAYQQRTQWTCSAACLKAVMNHWGLSVPELYVVQAVGAQPGRGAETDQIAAAARQFGFAAFEYSFKSLDQAKVLLDQDIPIICDIQSFNNPGKGHYVVLVSIDDQRVQLMDPNTRGNWRIISRAEMNARWWDRAMAPPHDLMWKWGIVVIPQEDGHDSSPE